MLLASRLPPPVAKDKKLKVCKGVKIDQNQLENNKPLEIEC
jgi:hypothetical protein